MSLDVYSHVMPPDEVASERFLVLLTRSGGGDETLSDPIQVRVGSLGQ